MAEFGKLLGMTLRSLPLLFEHAGPTEPRLDLAPIKAIPPPQPTHRQAVLIDRPIKRGQRSELEKPDALLRREIRRVEAAQRLLRLRCARVRALLKAMA